jgi:hypothetical protein
MKPSDVLKNIPAIASLSISDLMSSITQKIQSNLIKPLTPNLTGLRDNSMTQTINVDKFVFPDIKSGDDAKSFMSQLKSFAQSAYFNSQAGGMS